MIERKLEKTIPINPEMYKDMKNMLDFYIMTGLTKVTGKDYAGKLIIDPAINVTLIGMNSEDCEALKQLMIDNNYKKGKMRHYSKKRLETMASWEMLYYAPMTLNPAFTKEPDIHEHGLLYLYEGWDKSSETT